MTTEFYARSSYEVSLDIDYAIALSGLHQRLFGRLKRLISVLNIVGGSAAFVSVIGQRSSFAAVCGLLVAITSIVDLVYDFGGAADAHRRDKQEFLKLRGRIDKLSVKKLESELARIQEGSTATFDSLHRPVFNENLIRHGRMEYLLGLSLWERLCRALA